MRLWTRPAQPLSKTTSGTRRILRNYSTAGRLLLASMAQLTQWTADAAAPPTPNEQLKRAQQALTHCETSAQLPGGLANSSTNPQAGRALARAAESQCGHAVQLARTVLTAPRTCGASARRQHHAARHGHTGLLQNPVGSLLRLRTFSSAGPGRSSAAPMCANTSSDRQLYLSARFSSMMPVRPSTVTRTGAADAGAAGAGFRGSTHSGPSSADIDELLPTKISAPSIRTSLPHTCAADRHRAGPMFHSSTRESRRFVTRLLPAEHSRTALPPPLTMMWSWPRMKRSPVKLRLGIAGWSGNAEKRNGTAITNTANAPQILTAMLRHMQRLLHRSRCGKPAPSRSHRHNPTQPDTTQHNAEQRSTTQQNAEPG